MRREKRKGVERAGIGREGWDGKGGVEERGKVWMMR